MKILAVNGSPHKNGNTVKLIQQIFAGAGQGVHECAIIHLVDLHLDYCSWCGECAESGICRVQDGLNEHIQQIHTADVLIVATPSSTRSVTGYMKNWLDRFCNSQLCFQVDAERKVSMSSRVPSGKQSVIVVQGCTNLFQETVEPINVVMSALKIPVFDRLIVPHVGLTDQDTIEQHPDALQAAYQIGQRLSQPAVM